MKEILVVGKSISEARSVADEIVEMRGEDVIERTRDDITTSVAHYQPIALFAVERAKDLSVDEIYVIGDIPAQRYKQVEAVLKTFLKDGEVQVFEINENNTHFYDAK